MRNSAKLPVGRKIMFFLTKKSLYFLPVHPWCDQGQLTDFVHVHLVCEA